MNAQRHLRTARLTVLIACLVVQVALGMPFVRAAEPVEAGEACTADAGVASTAQSLSEPAGMAAPTETDQSHQWPAPTVTSPAAPVVVDAHQFTIGGTSHPNLLVRVWVDANGNRAKDADEVLAGSQQLANGGKTYSIPVALAQNQVNTFVVTVTDKPERPRRESVAAAVPPITESSAPVVISEVADQPDPFSPNGDGVNDSTAISYVLSRAATARLEVTDQAGSVVRNLLDAPRPGGRSTESWDGKLADGAAAPDGTYTYRIDATAPDGGVAEQRTGAVVLDASAPTVAVSKPVANARTSDRALTATAEDAVSGVAEVRFQRSSDGGATWVEVGMPLTTAPYTASLPDDEPDGHYMIRAVATDQAGTATTSDVVSFDLDTTPPAAPSGLSAADVPDDAGGAIALQWTPSSSTDVVAQCVLRGTDASGPFAVVVVLNDSSADAYVDHDSSLVNETTYHYVVVSLDGAGHRSPRSNGASAAPSDNRDVTAPDTSITSGPTDPTTLTTASFTFDSTEPGSSFACRLDDAEFTPCTSPADYDGLGVGSHTFEVKATDAAANTDATPARHTWTVLAPAPELPPDPVTVAPAVDPSVATDVASATKFLYRGPNPIQTGVAPDAIDPVRAAVVRGRVLGRDGQPISGVAVTVVGHPDLGRTVTRIDGVFDLATNGGEALTLDFNKDGFPPVQRQVRPSWQDYEVLDDVVMVPFDVKVTTIDFSEPVQTAQSSPVTDADGTRQATLLFAAGTEARMFLPDGSFQVLPTLNVRATEYTVGPEGRKAMPADLPAASAYTYAVELSVDEAVAAGATEVRFTKPVVNYTENFLGFPVGSPVPTGYYDRQKAAWVPAPNGRVVKVLSVAGGKADLDIAGSGQAADAAALAALGVTDAEREELARLYSPGQGLWRVAIDHFTPWDHNWPFGPPADAAPPTVPSPRSAPDMQVDCSTPEIGSIIGCENQTLGEELSVTGTPYSLHYQSDRVPGRMSTVDIPLTGAALPPSLRRVELVITVAGRRFEHAFPATPNQSYRFAWDGKDAYGRKLQGAQTIVADIGYVYPGVYRQPGGSSSAFAAFGGQVIEGSRAREELTFWRTWQGRAAHVDVRGHGLGAWTLDVHHLYDPSARVLHKGDGSTRSQRESLLTIETAAGNGTGARTGDGKATEVGVPFPNNVAVAPDGSIYISIPNQVLKVVPDGGLSTFAGTGTTGCCLDGNLATQALVSGGDLAFGPDGSVYVADIGNRRVRRVDPSGYISTIAGTGLSGSSGDGGPAVQAALDPSAVSVAADGSLLVADRQNKRVRKVDPSGIITTVAGTGVNGDTGDGGPATGARITASDIVSAPDGSFYINSDNHRVRKVSPDGIISTVAGTGIRGYSGDGGPAAAAKFSGPRYLALGFDGTLFIADEGNRRIRAVNAEGIITTVAGDGSMGSGGDGGPAKQAQFLFMRGIAGSPDGTLLVADQQASRVRRILPALPGLTLEDLAIPADDGSAVYIFSASGRHLRTLNSLTGAELLRFTYDAAGRLASVVDGYGAVTRLERGPAGEAEALVAPGGQRTSLSQDGRGYLTSVANPAGETTQMTYTEEGLLTTLTDRRRGVHRFAYDSGLLVRDESPDGRTTTLSRTVTPTGFRVETKSALARVRTYEVERLATGGIRRVLTDATGARAEVTRHGDGTTTAKLADGSVLSRRAGPDPRFGMVVPVVSTESLTTPRGLTRATSSSISAVLINRNDPLSVKTLTEKVTVNGQTTTFTYDGATRHLTSTTPEGRTRLTVLDAQGRTVRKEAGADLEPILFTYDELGRLSRTDRGTRTFTYAYDDANRLGSVTDVLGRKVSYTYDGADRIASMVLPSGSTYRYGYDTGGDLTSVTMPSGDVHTLRRDPSGRQVGYDPPGDGSYTSTYDVDGSLTKKERPGGAVMDLSYDPSGRITRALEGDAAVDLAYGAIPNRVERETFGPVAGGPPNVRSYGFDGPLVSSLDLVGAASGRYSYTYNTDLRPIRAQLTSGSDVTSVDLGYDRDGGLTRYGPFTMARTALLGSVNTMGDGTALLDYDYDRLSRLEHRKLSTGSNTPFDLRLSRDGAGQIVERVEQVAGGEATTTGYSYDADSRLTEVRRQGQVVERYAYDENGNRTSSQSGNEPPEAATYDAQDRLVTKGATTYEYTPDGLLARRGADTFGYGFGGQLTSATVGGETVSYGYDASGHRISRTDSSGTTQYLYGSLGRSQRVTAVRTPDGVLTTLFYDHYDQLVAMERGGARFYVSTDQVGSPRVVSDASGAVVKVVEYDAFGRTRSDSNPSFDLPIGFAGGLSDARTGLVHFGARDYDPGTGRFTAPDPVQFRGGQGNLYVYVGNNPISRRDPSGLTEEEAVEQDEAPAGEEGPSLWDTAKERFKDWATEKVKQLLCWGPLCPTLDEPGIEIEKSVEIEVEDVTIGETGASCTLGFNHEGTAADDLFKITGKVWMKLLPDFLGESGEYEVEESATFGRFTHERMNQGIRDRLDAMNGTGRYRP